MMEIVNDFGTWVAYINNCEYARNKSLPGLLMYLNGHARDVERLLTEDTGSCEFD